MIVRNLITEDTPDNTLLSALREKDINVLFKYSSREYGDGIIIEIDNAPVFAAVLLSEDMDNCGTFIGELFKDYEDEDPYRPVTLPIGENVLYYDMTKEEASNLIYIKDGNCYRGTDVYDVGEEI